MSTSSTRTNQSLSTRANANINKVNTGSTCDDDIRNASMVLSATLILATKNLFEIFVTLHYHSRY